MGKHLPDTVLRAGAAFGLAVTYGVPTRFISGPEGRWLETFRRWVSRLFAHIDERMGPRPITDAEYAGTLDMPPALADQLLWTQGFVRNPLSRLKTLDGQSECGSWVVRTSPLSHRQLHVMLFRDDSARTCTPTTKSLASIHSLAVTI